MYEPFLNGDDDTSADMAYDAILRNLAVIGEAVKTLPERLTNASPDISWHSIAGLRNIVIHEYFRIDRAAVVDILARDLRGLDDAIRQQLAGLPDELS